MGVCSRLHRPTMGLLVNGCRRTPPRKRFMWTRDYACGPGATPSQVPGGSSELRVVSVSGSEARHHHRDCKPDMNRYRERYGGLETCTSTAPRSRMWREPCASCRG